MIVQNCGECAVVRGTGRWHLHPISMQCPFQMLGVNIMELPLKKKHGNCYVINVLGFSDKMAICLSSPNQKAIRIAQLLTEEMLVFQIHYCLIMSQPFGSCYICDKCTYLLFFYTYMYFFHVARNQLHSCTHVSALLVHVLMSIAAPQSPLQPAKVTEGQVLVDDDNVTPVTSRPCKWKPPQKRKENTMSLGETHFEKHTWKAEEMSTNAGRRF